MLIVGPDDDNTEHSFIDLYAVINAEAKHLRFVLLCSGAKLGGGTEGLASRLLVVDIKNRYTVCLCTVFL